MLLPTARNGSRVSKHMQCMPCTPICSTLQQGGCCRQLWGRTAGPRGAAGPPPHAPAPPPPARNRAIQNPLFGPAAAPHWLSRLESVYLEACLARLAAIVGGSEEPENLTSEWAKHLVGADSIWECTLAPVVDQDAVTPAACAACPEPCTLAFPRANAALPGTPCAGCRPGCGAAPPACAAARPALNLHLRFLKYHCSPGGRALRRLSARMRSSSPCLRRRSACPEPTP